MLWRLIYLSFTLASGVVLGCGAKTETSTFSLTGSEDKPGTSSSKKVTAAAGLTLVRGAGELGSADYLEKKTCTFSIQNDSGKPLTLVVSDKSCACSSVEITPASLAPKQLAQVTLQWVPKADQLVTEEVRVSATIQAKEDPKATVTLEARGRIRPAIHLSLPRGELDFGRMDVADLKAGKELAIEVYTQDERHKNFTLEATASNPGLRFVPNAPQRLSSERLATLRAVAGYRLNLQCGEGLPIGRFRETVRLKSDAYPDRPLEIVVLGWVESGAVSVNPDTVSLPEQVPLETGYRCPPIEITLRGEPARTLRFVEATPSFLQVQVQPIRPNVWRVTASIPAGEEALRKHLTGSQLEDLLSYGFPEGALTFATDHSRLPILRIPVAASRLRR